MNIKMAGIDHSKAALKYREYFSFTKSAAVSFMEKIKENYPVDGCVLILTCNRTELWLSYGDGNEIPPAYDVFCKCRGVDQEAYRDLFVQREGREAVAHLFELTCGMKSMVFGEMQILTQVKDSIALARENGMSDPVLETLFRQAVTAAKKVVTQVRLTAVDRSVATSFVNIVKREYRELAGRTCLVIGNGEMGRLAAKALVEEGCKVVMTLRQYKNGEVTIPFGCEVIHYDDRYSWLSRADVVVSATSSPHYTLKFEETAPVLTDKPLLAVDLAVPRDIDPKLGSFPNLKLYDIDMLGERHTDETDNEGVRQAKGILEEYINEFESWYYFRELIPDINGISEVAAKDVTLRAEHKTRGVLPGGKCRDEVLEAVYQSSYKVVGKLMFGLKESLSRELWQSCIDGLKKAAEK